jgi:hypothetical protein
MNLNELFSNKKKIVSEGGNLSLPGGHEAQQIDLKVHNRSYIVPILDTLLLNINNSFAKKYKKPLWQPQLLQSKQFLSGSSLHFFNTKGITDQQFVEKKPKVGDIDTQVNKENEQELEQWLSTSQGKMVGNAKFLGFQRGNEQFSSLWELQDPPIKVQIDLEFVAFDKDEPTPWSKFSHSSSWDDLNAGVKGVFHKFLIQSLASLSKKDFLLRKAVGRGKAKEIQDVPTTDNMVSFAVSSKEGGGLRAKYEPVLDANGQPLVIDGMPVMQALPATGYEQDIGKIFGSIFGSRLNPKQAAQLESKYWSFVGLIDAMNTLVSPEEKQSVLSAFIDKIFGKGAQGLYKGDPERDSAEKSAALDLMISKLGVQAPGNLEQMKQQYKAAYKVTAESLQEAEEVKAQFRKNMPHLRDLKPADLLDLIDEIHDGNGNFKLQNIPLNVKVDGFGGRFGKDAEGKPFMATSNTPPRYAPSFVKYHQEKGTTDPEILGRAQNFDKLFLEMMNAIKLVDSKLGPEFLVNKQVTCEVLFLPFATETPEGKLKFVGIHYDKLPEGIQLALVPFRVVDATSGEDLGDAQSVVKQLTGLGKQGSVMFIDNSLTQKEGLDVTAIVPPVENIEQIKAMLSSGKLAQKREAKEILAPVALALEKAIQEDPNILGKDLLGQDYEGIVINSRLGPIKVTSSQQKKIIADKQAAKAAARTEQPRTGNKTAVVAIGSFVGHKGHQQLFGLTINKAKEVGGDPYLFMGNAVGVDDPIPVADKIKTWKQLYPEYASNIGAVTQEGGSLMQKIKHELINPLPGKPPRYDNVIIMVGEDQAKMPIAQALMKAVNKFPGYEHVKVQLEVTPRGTGMSFTKLRNVLKTGDEQQAFQMWNDAFNGGQDGAKPLPSQWIKHLMDVSKTGMSTPQPKPAVKKPAAQPAPQPVQQPALSEMRLFNALMLNENFADGRNPQDKGDSKRHGVPTKASVSTLRKVAKQGGRKGQLAHWMANMKAGKAKKNEDFNGEYDDEAGMAQSNLRTMARAVDGLLKTIKSNDNLPEWGQEKIAKAEMMLVSVWDYLLSQKEMGMDPKINESKAVESLRQIVAELSNEKLGQYKKAASAQASAADKAGDYAKGNKRFSGIVKATKKQFANDAKGVAEGIFGLTAKEKGKIQHITAKISDIPGNWDHKNQTYTERGLADLKSVMKNERYLKYALSLTADDYEADGMAEDESNAMADTAKRLANKDDGKVAKLRAAGDKRREEHLKGRDIAKRNEDMLPTGVFAGSDKNKLAPQGQLKGTAPKKQPKHKLVGEELVDEHIVKVGNHYELKSKSSGKTLGRGSKEEMKKRERQVQYFKHAGEGTVEEGWKDKLAAAGLAGAMALGAGGAHARVTGSEDPGINRLTGKPIATQQATDSSPAKAEAPKGFSKEYLQKAADPNRFGRYMISVEKAQELLSKMTEIDEAKKKGADGKACWKGYKYAGTKNGKDKCVPIGEAYEMEMTLAILKLFEGKK